MSDFSKEDYGDAVAQVIHMTKFIKKHLVDEDMENLLDAREMVEDVRPQLSPKALKGVRDFDRTLLREIDWMLSEHSYLVDKRRRLKIDQKYWWYYLDEIKAGKMQLPEDLRGAA